MVLKESQKIQLQYVLYNYTFHANYCMRVSAALKALTAYNVGMICQ